MRADLIEAETGNGIARLLQIMARLRDPETGCPWDIEQGFASIAPYTIEEAYEVADAIERQAWDELEGELGDLLLQSVYHAQMGAEAGHFSFDSIAHRVSDKMTTRHPHVFGPEAHDKSADRQTRDWEAAKAAERADRAEAGVLDGVALGLPALMRALKLQKRAARVGFDWPAVDEVLDKIAEECAELAEARATGNTGDIAEEYGARVGFDWPAVDEVLDKIAEECAELAEARATGNTGDIAEEYGDLLFAFVNLGRHLGVEAEAALRGANAKFTRRFQDIEARLAARGKRPADSDLAEMDALWDAVKATEHIPK